MRYAGQAWEVNFVVPAPVPEARALRDSFEDAYTRIYGNRGRSEEDIQLVRVRLSAFGVIDKPSIARVGRDPGKSPVSTRPVYFDGNWHRSPVFDREALGYGAKLVGPAIVQEFGATTVIPPNWRGTIDQFGNISLGLE
jgi:N-methylhydantoinase A